MRQKMSNELNAIDKEYKLQIKQTFEKLTTKQQIQLEKFVDYHQQLENRRQKLLGTIRNKSKIKARQAFDVESKQLQHKINEIENDNTLNSILWTSIPGLVPFSKLDIALMALSYLARIPGQGAIGWY